MNSLAIVAFAGPAGSGKDTAGRILIEHYGFHRLSFAQPLKAMLAAAGYPEPATQDDKERLIPELGVSWRHMAQTLGTEWGRRQVNPDLWVILAEKTIRAFGGRWVITDCRFENEASMVRRMNGVVCHLTGRAHAMSEGTRGHISEGGIKVQPHDFLIDNSPAYLSGKGGREISDDASLAKLHEHVKVALRHVGAE